MIKFAGIINQINLTYHINMVIHTQTNELIAYIIDLGRDINGGTRLPSIQELSEQLGISVTRVREQLEVAKTLGLVEVKPRTGIRLKTYQFEPAVWNSVSVAINLNTKYFEEFSDLRINIEKSYWMKAVKKLSADDKMALSRLMDSAWEKLRSDPIRIPHTEHRHLHMKIYQHLDNTFVLGLLETYWLAYEAEGLNIFTDYEYLKRVWDYHQRMVDCILNEDYEEGYSVLVEHFDLLYHRPHLDS